MTSLQFQDAFGVEWRKFCDKPMFQALMEVIEDNHPIRNQPAADGDRLHGAPVYLNEAYGYERLRRLLVSLSDEPTESFEPKDKFREPEL
jgi:hypothetical protein